MLADNKFSASPNYCIQKNGIGSFVKNPKRHNSQLVYKNSLNALKRAFLPSELCNLEQPATEWFQCYHNVLPSACVPAPTNQFLVQPRDRKNFFDSEFFRNLPNFYAKTLSAVFVDCFNACRSTWY